MYRERKAEKRVGGGGGAGADDTMGGEGASGMPLDVEGLRSGLGGANDGGGVDWPATSASCDPSANRRSSDCISSSRKGVQK